MVLSWQCSAGLTAKLHLDTEYVACVIYFCIASGMKNKQQHIYSAADNSIKLKLNPCLVDFPSNHVNYSSAVFTGLCKQRMMMNSCLKLPVVNEEAFTTDDHKGVKSYRE